MAIWAPAYIPNLWDRLILSSGGISLPHVSWSIALAFLVGFLAGGAGVLGLIKLASKRLQAKSAAGLGLSVGEMQTLMKMGKGAGR